MNDIVYVYKQSGDGGQELKHSLRSLCNITHGKIFVVGDREDWFSDHIIHIPAEHSSPASMVDTNFKWLQACNDPRVSDDFYAFNDDFFITEPTTIPVLHANETDNLPISRHHNVVIRATGDWLRQHKGITNPLNYSLHVPMLMNKQKRIAVHHMIEATLGTMTPLEARTVYVNIYNIGGEFYQDAKTYGQQLPSATFISTMEYTPELAQLFKEESIYEAINTNQ